MTLTIDFKKFKVVYLPEEEFPASSNWNFKFLNQNFCKLM